MFGEPQVYRLAKNRLTYSIAAITIIAIVSFFELKNILLWLIFLILIALYLFAPFTYRLIISDDAISSISLFGTKTLVWIEVSEVYSKNGGIVLSNVDSDIKVFVNPQIEDYPEVIKFIQQKRPDIWKSQEITEFHQNILQNIFLLVIGAGLLAVIGILVFREGLTKDGIFPILVMFVMCAFLIWSGISKIRMLTLEENILIVKYLFWKRLFHVNDIESVSLEQEMNKNQINYSVHVKLKDGNKMVLERVNEGNPMLVNTLENWLKKYKEPFL